MRVQTPPRCQSNPGNAAGPRGAVTHTRVRGLSLGAAAVTGRTGTLGCRAGDPREGAGDLPAATDFSSRISVEA